MKKLIFLFTVFFSMPTVALAGQFTQANADIDRIGVQTGQVFFMSLKEQLGSCTHGVIYCPATNTDCKNYYPLIIAAKLANKKLLTVDFLQDNSSGYCSLTLVQIN